MYKYAACPTTPFPNSRLPEKTFCITTHFGAHPAQPQLHGVHWSWRVVLLCGQTSERVPTSYPHPAREREARLDRTGSGVRAGIACSMFLAEMVYDVSANIILDSCVRAVSDWDVITSMIKSWVFGTIISVVRATAREGLQLSYLHAMAGSVGGVGSGSGKP